MKSIKNTQNTESSKDDNDIPDENPFTKDKNEIKSPAYRNKNKINKNNNIQKNIVEDNKEIPLTIAMRNSTSIKSLDKKDYNENNEENNSKSQIINNQEIKSNFFYKFLKDRQENPRKKKIENINANRRKLIEMEKSPHPKVCRNILIFKG